MTTIPDRLPDPLATPRAKPGGVGKRGKTTFGRIMQQRGQIPAKPHTNGEASGAQVFNAHGFFQASPAEIASAVPTHGAAAGANPQARAAVSEIMAAPWIAAPVDHPLPPVPRSAADTRPSPDPMPIERLVTRAKLEKLRAPIPMLRCADAGSGSVVTEGREITILPERRSETPRATIGTAVAARKTTGGLDIAVRIAGADRGHRAKLRAAIVGLLARHGFLPGQVRINGAGDASSPQEFS